MGVRETIIAWVYAGGCVPIVMAVGVLLFLHDLGWHEGGVG